MASEDSGHGSVIVVRACVVRQRLVTSFLQQTITATSHSVPSPVRPAKAHTWAKNKTWFCSPQASAFYSNTCCRGSFCGVTYCHAMFLYLYRTKAKRSGKNQTHPTGLCHAMFRTRQCLNVRFRTNSLTPQCGLNVRLRVQKPDNYCMILLFTIFH